MSRLAILFASAMFLTGLHASEPEDCSRRLHANSELAVMRDVKMHVIKAWDNTRFAKNLTQRDLARRLHVSQSTVSHLLNNMDGNAWTVGQLGSLAEFLAIPLAQMIPEDLLRQLNPPESPSPSHREAPRNSEIELKVMVFYLSKGVFVEREDIADLVAVLESAASARGHEVDDVLIETTILRLALTRARGER